MTVNRPPSLSKDQASPHSTRSAAHAASEEAKAYPTGMSAESSAANTAQVFVFRRV